MLVGEDIVLIKSIPLKLSQSLCVLSVAVMELSFPTETCAVLCCALLCRKVL